MSAVLTMGNFDGVHLGHQALLRATLSEARAQRATAEAMFFDPHPSAFFQPQRCPPMLTSVARRRALLLEHAGLDAVDVRRFDAAFARQSPDAFVEDVLVGQRNAVVVVVGPDFRFGQGREGDVARLVAMGKARGFRVHVIPPVEFQGEPISSTRIRELLAQGDVASAAVLLGRPHDLTAEVVHGDHRGHTIGFPTANLAVEGNLAIPADGVYAVMVEEGGQTRAAVANVGVRPTFKAGRSLEVHILDFESDLYGTSLRVSFIERLRDEQRFESVTALMRQIGRDAEAARGRLAEVSAEDLQWQWQRQQRQGPRS